MEPVLILYPVFALAVLTFGIAIWLGKLRFVAVKRGDLSPKFYSYNSGADMPACLAVGRRNSSELFDLSIPDYADITLMCIDSKVGKTQECFVHGCVKFR